MKKQRLWFVVLSFILSILMCACLAACDGKTDGGNKGDGNKAVALAAPTVTIDGDGKATWNEVTNAVGYAYKIDDGAEQTVETREIMLENGQSVTVKAKGDGVNYTDSEWSKVEIYTVVVGPVTLGTPMVTIYNDGLATWGAIANASGYVVKIGENKTETVALSARLENGQAISVQAVGNGTSYLTGDFSSPKTYKAPTGNLSAPENLSVEIQGTDAGKVILNWNAVQGACGYKYVVNGAEQNAVTVEENSATVDLSQIDVSKLDSTWVFQVKAIGDAADEVADDGDYSDRSGSSNYCGEVEFAIADDEFYTVAEILKIMNYYGEHIPAREFAITGTIAANADGNAVLENGFTLFGEYVPELYLAIDGRLVNLNVTAMGALTVKGEVKGLSSSVVDFEDIEEDDRLALAVDTLEAWDMLKEESKIMGDFCLPVKLYDVSIMWDVDDDDTGAFSMDEHGNVTITCPQNGAEDIPVTLTGLLYIESNQANDALLEFEFAIAPDTRTPLAAPKINIDPKTGVATWNKIEHATGYRVIYFGYSNNYSEYVHEDIIIDADGNRSVQLKDTWEISVQALGDSTTYSNSDINSKQYHYYPETVEPDGTPLEFDLTKLTQTGNLSNANYIFGLACGNSSVFVSASASRVVLGNDDSNGVVTGTGFIKVGSSSNNGKITLNFNKKIKGVVITARQWNKDQNDKISVNGSEQQTASKNDWGIMYFNFAANKASTTVEIDTDNRVFIQSITVYVED